MARHLQMAPNPHTQSRRFSSPASGRPGKTPAENDRRFVALPDPDGILALILSRSIVFIRQAVVDFKPSRSLIPLEMVAPMDHLLNGSCLPRNNKLGIPVAENDFAAGLTQISITSHD